MQGLLILIAITAGLGAADPEPLPTPRDAVLVALEDLARHLPKEQLFLRYVYVQRPDDWHAVSIAVNSAASTVGTIILPDRLPGNFVLRIDLRLLAQERKDLVELRADWEQLGDDPYFAEVIEVFVVKGIVPMPAYVWKDGKRYVSDEVKAFRVPARHAGGLCGAAGYRALVGAINDKLPPPNGCGPLDLLWYYTASRAPIVEGRRLVARVLSQVDLGFGRPLYYEFKNFERQPNRPDKKSDLDVILERLGARLDRDFRAVIMDHSNVTDKKRRVLAIRQTRVLVGNGTGVVWITEDPSDKQVGFENDPFRNVFVFRHTAKEVLFEERNGLLVSLLVNEQGDLQDAAPPDVVADKHTPGTATTELHAGVVVCWRCHVQKEGRGFRTLRNDLRDITRRFRAKQDDLGRVVLQGVRILDDRSRGSDIEAQNRVNEVYDWDPEADALPAARIAVEQAMFRASGGLKIDEAVGALVGAYNAYVYDRVTPQDAAGSLGRALGPEAAAKFAGELLDDFTATFGRVDPTLVILAASQYDPDKKAWDRTVSRWQWEAIYAPVALSVQAGERVPLEAPPPN